MRKTDITKNAIMSSTIALLRNKGDVTVKEICDDAQVNIGAINYHFSDKETLLENVFRHLILDIKTKIESLLVASQSTTKRELVKSIINIFYSFVEENQNVIAFMVKEENSKYFDTTNKYFYNLFSVNSEIAYKMINALAPNITNDEEKKSTYLAFLSLMILPIISKFKQIQNESDKGLFPQNDIAIKEMYIDSILKLLA